MDPAAPNSSPQRFLVYGLAFLLALSPLLYVPGLAHPSALPRYAVIGIGAPLLLAVWAFDAWRRHVPVRTHWLLVLVLAFAAFASLSGGWSQDPAGSTIAIVQLWGFAAVFVVAAQVARPGSLHLLAAVSVAAGSLAALLGVAQSFGFEFPGLPEPWPMATTFGLKNHAALYFDLLIGPALALLLVAEDKGRQRAWAVALGILLAFQLESRTRGSWLGLVVMAVVLAVVAVRRGQAGGLSHRLYARRRLVAGAVAFALVIFALPSEMSGYLGKKLERDLEGGSVTVRLTAYRNALHMLPEHPLAGTGYGSFRRAFREHTNDPHVIEVSNEFIYLLRLHNDPLQMFVETGLVGGLLALVIAFGVLRAGLVLHARAGPDEGRGALLVLGITLGLAASFAHALVDFPLHKPSSALQIWTWSGVLAGMAGRSCHVPAYLRKYFLFPVIVGVVFVVFSLRFYGDYLASDRMLASATRALKEGDCASAIRDVDASVKRFPYYFGSHVDRVRFHVHCRTRDLPVVLLDEIDWDPTNLEARLHRGRLLRASGRLEAAVRDFEYVLKVLPHRPWARIELAQTFMALGRFGEARRLLEEARELLAEAEAAGRGEPVLQRRLERLWGQLPARSTASPGN